MLAISAIDADTAVIQIQPEIYPDSASSSAIYEREYVDSESRHPDGHDDYGKCQNRKVVEAPVEPLHFAQSMHVMLILSSAHFDMDNMLSRGD